MLSESESGVIFDWQFRSYFRKSRDATKLKWVLSFHITTPHFYIILIHCTSPKNNVSILLFFPTNVPAPDHHRQQSDCWWYLLNIWQYAPFNTVAGYYSFFIGPERNIISEVAELAHRYRFFIGEATSRSSLPGGFKLMLKRAVALECTGSTPSSQSKLCAFCVDC